MSTVLAFDFGASRIGVATGSTELGIAHPLETIAAIDNDTRFARIAALLKEWQPGLLIVGLSTHVDGTATAMTQQTTRFARRLQGRFGIRTLLVDERLSSAAATEHLNEIGVRGRRQKPALDQVAAMQILQTYFDTPESALDPASRSDDAPGDSDD
ncbi:Holliday junction resolvase RuvX [Chitinilyticum litopenaei]|uniref:Holliday junction resolvase RuvX n=1 Tax=Chitinilyticum litopenaei TaxID=1121276 RepID=UPI0004071AF7|nr:Holliday junction resolvase RuvX [Chitinilyticum litopenaei]